MKELLLISQDTSFYGVDRGERGALARLLRELNTVDGLEWIRMLYLYPTTIGDDVLDAVAECEKVCSYIDLPLQHASDAVLKRMKRPGTRASYERLLDRIRTRIPGVTLRTTFIVGFPGETDDDFSQLQDFVRSIGFDHLGVFTYSHEEGTSAYELDDDVPAKAKSARRSRVMSLQKRLVELHHVGTGCEQVLDLFVEGSRAVHRERGLVVIVLVKKLLRHCEWARNRDPDRLVVVVTAYIARRHVRLLVRDRAGDTAGRRRPSSLPSSERTPLVSPAIPAARVLSGGKSYA